MRSTKLKPFYEVSTKETSVRTLMAFVLIAEGQVQHGSIWQDELCEQLEASKSACARCCRQLEEIKLISREAPEGQAHRRLINLTAKGENLFRSMI